MKKTNVFIISLILITLVLVGASCGEDKFKEKEESIEKGIFTLAEKNVASGKNSLKVSNDGHIVYFFDSDENKSIDTIIKTDANGKTKKEVKIKGGLLEEDVQLDNIMAVDQSASKVVFAATLPSQRDEYGGKKCLYVLSFDSESLIGIPNQGLSDHFEGAGWADAASVAISPDGEKIVFGLRFWGISFGAAYDIGVAIVVANSDGSGMKILAEEDISLYVVGIDNSHRVFFAKKEDKYDYFLSVINADGSGEKNLGLKINTGKISVSKNGIVAGTLDEKGEPVFVCDANGNILAKGGDPWGTVEISGNGEKVSSAEWDKGLFLYGVNNNFEKENILDKSYGNCAVHDVDESGRIIVCLVNETGELLSIVK